MGAIGKKLRWWQLAVKEVLQRRLPERRGRGSVLQCHARHADTKKRLLVKVRQDVLDSVGA